MKWLFVLFLAIIIFGGAAWFGYNYVFKEDIQVAKEQRGETTPEPRIDLSLRKFFKAQSRLRLIPRMRAQVNLKKARKSEHGRAKSSARF